MSTLRVLTGLLFVLTFQKADACTMVSTVFVSSPITCNGNCDGVITLLTSGGTAPYVVNNPVTGGTITYMGTTTISGFCTGTYTLSITDAMGCNNVQVITVTQPTAVDVMVTGSNESTPGASDGSITATASGGASPYVYSLNGGPQQASGNFSGLPAGTYTVCAMDANGCESCETLTINSGAGCAMVSTVFVTTPISCNGSCDGVVTLASTMGTAPYMTNNPFGTGTVTYTSSTTFSGVCAGVYTFSITDAAGCNNIQVLTVTQPSALSLSLSATPVSSAGACDGSITPTASGGQPAYTFTINSVAAGTPPFTGLCQGIYTVCVSDANGCITCEPVDLSSPLGINEPGQNSFNFYPNPTTGKITISSTVTHGRLMLTNVLGQPLLNMPMSTKTDLDLDAMGLENGIYFVNFMQNNNIVQTSRIVLSR